MAEGLTTHIITEQEISRSITQDEIYQQAVPNINLASRDGINRIIDECIVSQSFEAKMSGRKLFDWATPAYLITNEDQTVLTNVAPLRKNAKVSAIVASTDYMAYAVANGAQEITGIETSLVACFFGELKFASRQELSRNEFLSYWGLSVDEEGFPICRSTQMESAFNNIVYQTKLRSHLSETAKLFFDTLAEKGKSVDNIPFQFNLLRVSKDRKVGLPMNIATDESYNQVQTNLRNGILITFYPGRIPEVLINKPKSDIIYTSNVPDYVPDAQLSNFFDGVLSQTDNGIIISFTSPRHIRRALAEIGATSETYKKEGPRIVSLPEAVVIHKVEN